MLSTIVCILDEQTTVFCHMASRSLHSVLNTVSLNLLCFALLLFDSKWKSGFGTRNGKEPQTTVFRVSCLRHMLYSEHKPSGDPAPPMIASLTDEYKLEMLSTILSRSCFKMFYFRPLRYFSCATGCTMEGEWGGMATMFPVACTRS